MVDKERLVEEGEAIERAFRILMWNDLRKLGVTQDDAILRINAEIETIKANARSLSTPSMKDEDDD